MGNRAQRKKGGPKFVQIYFNMIDAPAWKQLSPVARALYVELKRSYNGTNNGSIGFGCRAAAQALGVGVNTANRAFKDLEFGGFIVATTAGHFSSQGSRATEWRLTEAYDDQTGQAATRDYLKSQTEKQNPVPSQRRPVPSQRRNGKILPRETDLRLPHGTQTANPASHISDTYISNHRGRA